MQINKEGDKLSILLAENSQTENLVKIRLEILDNLAGIQQIVINAKEVKQIDTPTIQLLLSLRKTAIKSDIELRYVDQSADFTQAFSLLVE